VYFPNILATWVNAKPKLHLLSVEYLDTCLLASFASTFSLSSTYVATMSTYGPADDESVVCVTPTEGSVKEEPILITSDDAHKDNAKDDDKESGTDSDKVIDKPTIEVVVPSTRKGTGMPPSPPKEEVTMVKVGMVCDKKTCIRNGTGTSASPGPRRIQRDWKRPRRMSKP
jgi:hypothetical protein